MGRYKFYCNKIEKDDKQTLYAFFYPKIRFYSRVTDENLNVDGLDWITIG